jgi:uncharacterized protein (DUF2141 family)
MKHLLFFCSFVFLLSGFIFLEKPSMLKPKPLKLIFKNIPNSSATIRIGVFRRQDNFPDVSSVFRFYDLKPNGNKEASLEITDLAYGEYVFGCFQDTNGNNVLDMTSEGFPTEPVTISNGFVITSYAPSFDECKIQYSKKSREFVFEKYTSGM